MKTVKLYKNTKIITCKQKTGGYKSHVFLNGEVMAVSEHFAVLKRDSLSAAIIAIDCNYYNKYLVKGIALCK